MPDLPIERPPADPEKLGSIRVDMSQQLAGILKRHRLESRKKGLALGMGDLPEYAFINANGGILDKDNWRKRVFNRRWKKQDS